MKIVWSQIGLQICVALSNYHKGKQRSEMDENTLERGILFIYFTSVGIVSLSLLQLHANNLSTKSVKTPKKSKFLFLKVILIQFYIVLQIFYF